MRDPWHTFLVILISLVAFLLAKELGKISFRAGKALLERWRDPEES